MAKASRQNSKLNQPYGQYTDIQNHVGVQDVPCLDDKQVAKHTVHFYIHTQIMHD